MKIVEKIKSPIYEEMELFEKKFAEIMSSKVPLLNRITYFIVKRKGKQIRPMLVFLVAKMISLNKLSEKSYRGASILELIHTATLVHDDIVDDSNQRRGFFSINALWKNKIAVLVGDYLLSKGLLVSIDNEDYDLLKIVSDVVREISEGELLQIEKSRDMDLSEEMYYKIIEKKTAVLLAACCAIGATSVSENQRLISKMYEFGKLLGIAFQIKDDLFDYGKKKIGKPLGIDIRERKVTLPFIYSLTVLNQSEKKWMINTIKNYNKDKNRVLKAISKIKEVGGLDYARKKMKIYRDKALKILDDFPNNPYKDSLILLANFVVDRDA
ncbi:MAG: polyprenyl synthetase [Flavobacteriaceae bacterium]|nr:polyprenyl synthetase [Flavobacteriaceae bacterium]|tara:strand:+ start:1433 stop:2410 length:978 start_codon:yes stop_codon:yes gene_type:complete